MEFEKVDSLIFSVASEIGFDPQIPLEAEEFHRTVVEEFEGELCDFVDWYRGRMQIEYKFLSIKPVWIQNPEWPFLNGHPMVFVGQIDVDPGLFHDSASFYIFYSPINGEKNVIIQVQ